ncbi:MAG: hypothetical protein MUO68_15755, partial [Desulfobacteraceae bacterium]|nr:hypothetical protein [Desulfobacteraceae bacterium]
EWFSLDRRKGCLNWDHGATIVLVVLHGFGWCGVQGSARNPLPRPDEPKTAQAQYVVVERTSSVAAQA